VHMTLTPVSPAVDPPGLRFSFSISVGVRRGEQALRARIDAALQHRHREIQRILLDYHIPMVEQSCGETKEAACE
jgi:mxaJ protein